MDNNIKQLRESAGLTQRELADRIGCTVQSVSNWEAGSQPSGGYIPRIARALGVSMEKLYQGAKT